MNCLISFLFAFSLSIVNELCHLLFPPGFVVSSAENASDGRFPPGARNSGGGGSEAPQLRKKSIVASKSTPPDSSYATTARKRTPLKGSDKKASTSMFQKKKPLNWKVEIAVQNDKVERDENVPEGRLNEKSKLSKPETKRALFLKNSEDKGLKFGGFRSGSRVAPCQEEGKDSTVGVSNVPEDTHKNHIECEELSSIRNQLVQIEKQQSSLMDLLQVFFLLLEILLSFFFFIIVKWNFSQKNKNNNKKNKNKK